MGRVFLFFMLLSPILCLTQENITDSIERKQGHWQEIVFMTDSEDSLIRHSNYLDDIPIGIRSYYRKQAKLLIRKDSLSEQGIILKSIHYFPNKQISGITENDSLGRHRKSIEFSKNKKVLSVYEDLYQDGLHYSIIQSYHDNGALALLYHTVNNKKEGSLIQYYNDSSIKEIIHYNQGFLDGKKIIFNPKGDIILYQNYILGNLFGYSYEVINGEKVEHFFD